jgi:hypothetical protein
MCNRKAHFMSSAKKSFFFTHAESGFNDKNGTRLLFAPKMQ